VLTAQRHNELLVCLLFARFVKDAHVCLATIEGFASLTQTARETVVDERELQHALECFKNGHLPLACGGIGRHLDLLGGDGLGILIVFSVRLQETHLVSISSTNIVMSYTYHDDWMLSAFLEDVDVGGEKRENRKFEVTIFSEGCGRV
jgi:hypothetical protein